jgi:hypothetical protein
MNRLYFGDNRKWLSAENSGDAATKGQQVGACIVKQRIVCP